MMQSQHGYSMYITVNPHTDFRPKKEWIGDVVREFQGIGGSRRYPVKLWYIKPIELSLWQVLLSKAHIKVINMVMTKKPEVIGPL